uniref:Ubiquitin-like protease family profile domain-containing protein n=1 Tax=Tanacetum cinerariifolium TaxID=118510 RepID=A0A6L2JLW4_TANCI|nr:hypothetical protein [Tanacetum cinerariifolium]
MALDHFCEAIAKIYGPEFLRKPTVTDIEKLYRHHKEKHGFPRMLGSLDCTDWEWFGCPYAFKGQYVRRDHGSLEAVASQDLWIWHAFFGVAGSNNDINLNECKIHSSIEKQIAVVDSNEISLNLLAGLGFVVVFREEFCLVTGLKFGVENWTDYNDEKEPIPFRRRVFCSSLDGRPIRGKNVETLINSEAFKTLADNDAVSLCCVGILHLVLLGLEDGRLVPNWILRLANDRDGWDNYPWGSHVWPTLYQLLNDANVRRWPALYATRPKDEVEERIPRHLNRNNYFEVPSELYREFEEQKRGYKQMMKKCDDMYEKMSRFMEDMSVGPVPLAKEPIIVDQHYGINDLSGFQSYKGVPSAFHTLANSSSFFNMATPSNWQTPIPSYLGTPNSQPLSRRILQMMKKCDDMYEKMSRFMEDMSVGPVPLEKEPIIVDQHYGINDLSGFQSYQGVPSAFHTLANSSSFFNMATSSNWQTPIPSYLGTPNSQPLSRRILIQILIRERAENDNCTLSKSSTICLHPENNRFMVLTDLHIIGTLDGTMRPYPSWKDVNWVYMPINVGGVHWVTGVINLVDSIFYVFDSMESESRC